MSDSSTKSVVEKYAAAIEARKGTVAISDIEQGLIKPLQCRAAINSEAVTDYAAAMTKGRGQTPDTFPPVRIWLVDDTLYLVAGHHRWRAAKVAQNGKGNVEAEFSTGIYLDALLDAVQSNAKHGLRPNRADIRKTLTLLFEAAKYRNMSDNRLGKLVGCSPTTVGVVPQVGGTQR